VIEHTYGDRFTLGEPDGSRSPRVNALSEALIAAGFKAPVRPRIRDELWVKLWGNLAFNPISALTTATLDVLTADAGQRGVAREMMLEAQAVGEALGVRFGIDVDKRIAGAAEVGAHKTSMLQDLERGGRWRSTRCSAWWWSWRSWWTGRHPPAGRSWRWCGRGAGLRAATSPRSAGSRRASLASGSFRSPPRSDAGPENGQAPGWAVRAAAFAVAQVKFTGQHHGGADERAAPA
jgi:hypothetical protein